MNTTLRIAATTFAVLLLSGIAEAKRNRAPRDVITCGQHGCSDWFKSAPGAAPHDAEAHGRRHSPRRPRTARGKNSSPPRAMQIDKPQEYAVVGPNGQLEKRESHEAKRGIIRSAKTGATARVSPKHAAAFQSYINDLEAMGAKIYYMGGYRNGRCSAGSQHPCGSALDVCQDSRGRVSGARDCHLPGPAAMAAAAARRGLHEGSVWCRRPDYGHVQAIKTGSTCSARGWVGDGKRHYLASMTGEVRSVSESPRKDGHRKRGTAYATAQERSTGPANDIGAFP